MSRTRVVHLFVDGAKGQTLCGSFTGLTALSIVYSTCAKCRAIFIRDRKK